MTFHIVTIFPEIFNSYFNESIIKRAQVKGLIKIQVHNLRDWTTDKHRTVDDTPYGGGAGMVMKVEPICKAIQHITHNMKHKTKSDMRYAIRDTRVVLLSAKGKTWNQSMARKYSKLDNIIFVCGRYEGVDERVKKFVDEEISIGDYVLTGGELPAMTIIDSITRLLPGVLGNKESLINESFNNFRKRKTENGKRNLEYPQYTRPDVFNAAGKKLRVPKVLLGGNHKKIEKWREKKTKTI